jgi:hypothetical protein
MRPASFDIVFRLDAWHFVTDEVVSRPYQTQATAIHAAEAFLRAKGVDARVRIYRFDGIPQEERIYSRAMATASNRQS